MRCKWTTIVVKNQFKVMQLPRTIDLQHMCMYACLMTRRPPFIAFNAKEEVKDFKHRNAKTIKKEFPKAWDWGYMNGCLWMSVCLYGMEGRGLDVWVFIFISTNCSISRETFITYTILFPHIKITLIHHLMCIQVAWYNYTMNILKL